MKTPRLIRYIKENRRRVRSGWRQYIMRMTLSTILIFAAALCVLFMVIGPVLVSIFNPKWLAYVMIGPSERRVPETHMRVEIPKIIHSVALYPNNYIPEPVLANKRNNPEYTLHVLNNDSAEDYIIENCPELHEAFIQFRPKAFKANVLRYCVLWTDGGVYIDSDVELVLPLDEIIPSDIKGVLVPWDQPTICGRTVQVGFIVAPPRHPAVRCAIDRVVKQVAERFIPKVCGNETSGCGLFSKCIDKGTVEVPWYDQALGKSIIRIADNVRIAKQTQPLFHSNPDHWMRMYARGEIYADSILRN